MVKDFLHLLRLILEFFIAAGPVVGTLCAVGFALLAYGFYVGMTKDINYNPDHWSHKGDVHNWVPEDKE